MNSHEFGKMRFVEMFIMPQKINKLNAIHIKISMIFFTEVEKHSKIHVELQKSQKAKTVLSTKF